MRAAGENFARGGVKMAISFGKKRGERQNSTEWVAACTATQCKLLISCRCSMLLFLCSCSCWYSSCTADVLAALLPHTQQRERPAQRSALSATALTSKHVAASSAAATNAMAPTARSAPLEKFEPLARRQKRPFACTFWACEFEHQKPKRSAFSRSGEPTL